MTNESQMNNNKKWELKPFFECFKIYPTNSYSRDKLTYDEGIIKNVHYGDVHKFLPVITDVNLERLPYLKKEIDTAKIKSESFCCDGDVVIADTAEDFKGVGKAIELSGIGSQKIVSGLHTYLCRDEDGVFVDGFRGYLMNSPIVHNQIVKYAAGMKVYSITKTNLSKIFVPVPPLPEQRRIASILSAADKAIEEAGLAVEESERMKKGLMQKLLDNENCVSFKLGDVVDINSESRSPNYENKDDIIFYVDIDAVENSTGKIISPKKLRFKDAPSRARRVIRNDDVIVSMVRPELKAFAYVSGELDGQICSTGFAVLRGKGLTNPTYLLNIMFSEQVISQFRKLTVGGQYPSLTQKTISQVEVYLPSLPEQQRIASILSTADEKISLCKKRKALLEKTKLGLMQKLLN